VLFNYGSKTFYDEDPSGLYHKPMIIINDDYRVINKLEASLTDNARVVIFERHMFIVQATGLFEGLQVKLEMKFANIFAKK
jgi:hypothetical protein